jgi:Zn-dependent membrane protease YugP
MKWYMFYQFDPLYWMLIIPGFLLGLYAQIKLSSTYGKYMRVAADSGLSGAQAARRILDNAGLSDVPIEEIPGNLTDHYDPRKRALFLSSGNFNERSISAVGVAAHEAGHALQHQVSYAPLNFRMAIVPVTNFASVASGAVLAGSVMLYYSRFISGPFFSHLMTLGIVLFAITALFQAITLPVEFDASRRAKEQLFRLGIVDNDERTAVSRVLSAAALTYVAGLVTALLQLLYWISVANRDRR